MRLLFIYLIPFSYAFGKFNHGISSISYVLKEESHDVDIISLSSLEKHKLNSKINDFTPDVFLISFSSNKSVVAKEISLHLSTYYPKTPIILGGVHPTVSPLECAQYPGINAVCAGSGEKPLLEIARRLSVGEMDFSEIPNLYIPSTQGISIPKIVWNFDINPDFIKMDPYIFDLGAFQMS